MRETTLLEFDGIGNLLLGVLFLAFPGWVADVLGLPSEGSRFYPTVFGAVLFGIGVALLLERYRGGRRPAGLGLAGALCINLSFGVALAVWLAVTQVDVSTPGALLLWALVVILVGLGGIELGTHLRSGDPRMTGEFRSSDFVDFNAGEVLLPPMKLRQQKKKPWTLEDKIEIFECRVEVWQLGVAVQILREMERRERRTIWSHAAYGLVAVIFSYFEMIGKTLNPGSKKRKTASSDFKVGFCDVYPQYTIGGKYSPEVSGFQDRVRNGMYHLGYTKDGLWIHHDSRVSTKDFDTKLPSEFPAELGLSGTGRLYLMDPHRVTRTIVQHFGGFVARLRQPDSKSAAMQAKFEEFFDDFHDSD